MSTPPDGSERPPSGPPPSGPLLPLPTPIEQPTPPQDPPPPADPGDGEQPTLIT